MNAETTDFMFKLKPLEHQLDDFYKTRDAEMWAYLYEMGLGKSKVTIDVAAWQFATGKIDFLLVVAPNGVHTNWITDEIPKHMPDWANCKFAEWGSQMKKAQNDAFEAVFKNASDRTSLRCVAMNIEAIGVQERYYKKKAGAILRMILDNFNVMFVVDESSFIKTAGINRTRRIITLGKYAVSRRILNGTPVTNGPLDLYSQYKFLAGTNSPLLGPYSLNKRSFDSHYAEWEEQQRRDGQRYKTLVAYRNMDELADYLDECSTRLTKKDCLDLPEKLYEKIHVTLHPEQQRRYKKALDDGMLILKTGDDVEITSVLTLWLRLQQIVGGFVPTEDPENTQSECILDDYRDLPRFQEFLRYIEQVQTGKIIIVCRFLAECHMWLDYFGDEAVSYIGKANYKDADERQRNKERFQGTEANDYADHDPNVRVLVMNKSAARGHTLTKACSMFFYSNSFSLDDRLQTEDRPHRIGQKNAVTYFDGYAEGTIDVKLVDAYREKKKLADIITRDKPGTWV